MRNLIRSTIISTGLTKLGKKTGQKSSDLMQQALEIALSNIGIKLKQLEAIISVPSLAEPRFMEAHYFATKIGLLPCHTSTGIIARTIDTGGAGPISAIIEADQMIRNQGVDLVAIVAGDSITSLPTEEFLLRADAGCNPGDGSLRSPIIPHGYDRIAKWQISQGTMYINDPYDGLTVMYSIGYVTREQLAMVSVLMSRQAVKHPYALTKKPLSLQDVLTSKPIGDVTNLLECARRADGAAAILIASPKFVRDHPNLHNQGAVILGSGEASGPLYPPKIIDESMFSCEEAVRRAYDSAQVGYQDIDFFGLYDCFPICFLRAYEAVFSQKHQGGNFIEKMYRLSEDNGGFLDPNVFPFNTHGGLLAFGAPWEVPAIYNVIEAVEQLNGTADNRQVKDCRRALCYGNGGIFSASAVVVLGKGKY